MNRRLLFLAAALALLPMTAGADDLRYSYVETGWVNVDPDVGESGSGPAFDVSYGLTDFVHLVGQYNDVDFDPTEMTTWGVGAGVHRTMGRGFDVFGEAAYVEAEIDVPLVGEFSEDGYSLCAGARGLITRTVELRGGINYVDLGDSDDTSFDVSALWNFNNRFALGAGYELGDDANTLFLGFRISFGQR